MKVTYLDIQLGQLIASSMGSQIILENLHQDPNIEVELKFIHDSMDDSKLYYQSTIFGPKAFSQFGYFRGLNKLYKGYYDEDLFSIKNDIVLFSLQIMFHLVIVKKLIEAGYKVVLGGSLVNILPIQLIKNNLIRLGINNFDNIIFIKGVVDLKTNLYKYIKSWEDVEIIENDFSTIWDFNSDYFPSSNYHSYILNQNTCFWGKCSFCMISKFSKIDFTGGLSSDTLAQSMKSRISKNKVLFISNDYLTPSEYASNLLLKIKDCHPMIYSGIKLMQDPEYFPFINNKVWGVRLGLENTSDFTLDRIRKGYRYENIKIAIENIKKYMDKNIMLIFNVIMDLPSKSIQDIKENYKRILGIREELQGFNVKFKSNFLHCYKEVDIIKDNLIEIKNIEELIEPSGTASLFNLMDEEVYIPSWMMLAFQRKDINGNIIPSDAKILEEEGLLTELWGD